MSDFYNCLRLNRKPCPWDRGWPEVSASATSAKSIQGSVSLYLGPTGAALRENWIKTIENDKLISGALCEYLTEHRDQLLAQIPLSEKLPWISDELDTVIAYLNNRFHGCVGGSLSDQERWARESSMDSAVRELLRFPPERADTL